MSGEHELGAGDSQILVDLVRRTSLEDVLRGLIDYCEVRAEELSGTGLVEAEEWGRRFNVLEQALTEMFPYALTDAYEEVTG